MAKKNVTANKEVVVQPGMDVQPVPETAGNSDTTQNAPEKPEDGEKELPIQSEQSGGEQTDGKGSAGVDSEVQETTTGKEGGETGDRLRNRIAKDVFEKNEQCKVLYFTADLIPFFVKSDAFRHGADKLKNDTIVTINRK
jgi:hypothetical protein